MANRCQCLDLKNAYLLIPLLGYENPYLRRCLYLKEYIH